MTLTIRIFSIVGCLYGGAWLLNLLSNSHNKALNPVRFLAIVAEVSDVVTSAVHWVIAVSVACVLAILVYQALSSFIRRRGLNHTMSMSSGSLDKFQVSVAEAPVDPKRSSTRVNHQYNSASEIKLTHQKPLSSEEVMKRAIDEIIRGY